MAMKRSFYTVDGEMIGERTVSGRVNYATDALGSVTGTLVGDEFQNTYAYKPYGMVLAKTGTAADPRALWVGALGYLQTGRLSADFYVRARHYSTSSAAWTSIDPLSQSSRISSGSHGYVYATANPTNFVDPSGLKPVVVQLCAFIEGSRSAYGKYPYFSVFDIWYFDLGVNTNARYFGKEPLDCKLFAQISIDSCDIGSAVPDVVVGTGQTRWVEMTTLTVLSSGSPRAHLTTIGRYANYCKSEIIFKAWATVWTRFRKVSDLTFPPIVMMPIVEFYAHGDQVSVGLDLKRTQFPDFEYHVNIDGDSMAERPSKYWGPGIGLIQPQIWDYNPKVFGSAPTSCECAGTCEKCAG